MFASVVRGRWFVESDSVEKQQYTRFNPRGYLIGGSKRWYMVVKFGVSAAAVARQQQHDSSSTGSSSTGSRTTAGIRNKIDLKVN